ncbi:hypothetical protein [Peribacillus sp. NPDC097295]|uniref:hypothetical protein n=1 Tax=Peribacillus sp. NPDC097295 TaxID=3364402 RepID=UPI003828A8A8
MKVREIRVDDAKEFTHIVKEVEASSDFMLMEAGVALYKKVGFEIEGTKRNSLVIHGKSYNEYYMAKIL